MDSDEATQIVFIAFFNFNKSKIETPSEFFDSENSPSTFSQPLFQPTTSQLPSESSSYTDVTPILSPMSGDQTDATSTLTDNQLGHELDKFIKKTTPP